MKKIVVIIPALNPGKEFIEYSEKLLKCDDVELIIIDDGSKLELKYIFQQIAENKRVSLITHEVNRGKGKSLKDGMQFFLDHYSKKKSNGIVTADCDGQHSAEDVIAIGRKINKQNSNTLIIGTRNFDLDIVPPKSKKGNKITTKIFKILYGKEIKDTQTGLRGLTRDFVEECISLSGDRYEFELCMLIKAVKNNVNIMQCYIKTIYYNNNEETHFRPVMDSIKIYKVMFREFFRFLLSGLSSSIIDIALFTMLFSMLNGKISDSLIICVPTILARIVSSLYNYFINKNIVFNDFKGRSTVFKYYLLCVTQALTSYIMVDILFRNVYYICPTALKLIVDTILFLISFQIQKRWVFRKRK